MTGATKYVIILAVVVVPVLGIVAYTLMRKKKDNARAEAILKLLEALSKRVDKNHEMLKEGNLGWRKLAKGESNIDMMPLVPAGEGESAEAYRQLKKEHPKIAKLVEKNDRVMEELRTNVFELVDKVEGPVRNQTQEDKQYVSDNKEAGRRYRQMLLGNEEIWMLVMETLVNESDVAAAGQSDQYKHFWADRGDTYKKIVEEKGGETWTKVRRLKGELRSVNEELEKSFRRLVRYIRAQRRGS